MHTASAKQMPRIKENIVSFVGAKNLLAEVLSIFRAIGPGRYDFIGRGIPMPEKDCWIAPVNLTRRYTSGNDCTEPNHCGFSDNYSWTDRGPRCYPCAILNPYGARYESERRIRPVMISSAQVSVLRNTHVIAKLNHYKIVDPTIFPQPTMPACPKVPGILDANSRPNDSAFTYFSSEEA